MTADTNLQVRMRDFIMDQVFSSITEEDENLEEDQEGMTPRVLSLGEFVATCMGWLFSNIRSKVTKLILYLYSGTAL